MGRELTEELHVYFEHKNERTNAEELFYMRLKNSLPYFEITTLHRDDLLSRGFDTSQVDDCMMKEIARKMSNAYQENNYWIDMDIIAEDRVSKYKCPKCWGDASSYHEEKCNCWRCDHSWEVTKPTGQYVLVESPEDSGLFRDHKIGFECYNSHDNGAMYVPEHIYTSHFDKRPQARQIFIPLAPPESQIYLDWEHTAPSKFARCAYINPADTVLNLGDNALLVPKSLLKKLNYGL